jgi:sugar lactone lactonase YvrE
MKRCDRRVWSSLVLCIVFSGAAWGAAGDIQREFPTPGRCPTGLAFDGKSLWLGDRMLDLIYQIDPADGRVIQSIAAPCHHVNGLVAEGDCLWALGAGENEKSLCKLNPKTGITERTLPVPCARPQGLAFDGKCLWVGDTKKKRLYQLAVDDGSVQRILTAPGDEVSGLAFDGKYLWVAERTKDMIYMVCPTTGRVILMFDSPFKYPRGLACDGDWLWNVDYQSHKIYRLVAHDQTPLTATEPKDESLEYTHRVRNYGPGTLTSLDIYLAIPHDLAGQKILKGPAFEPKPTEIVTDRWGQKIARFHFENVAVGQGGAATMKLDVRLLKTRFFLLPEKAGDLAQIPAEIKRDFLADGTKFVMTDPKIREAAGKIVGNETNCYWIARNIFDFVHQKIHYELDDSWDAAPIVLERGSGSCSEYSMLFIALCRAAGLPARYVGSVVVRHDDASTDTVFHRWPEVYLPGYGWVPMDPSSGMGIFPTPADEAAAVGNRKAGFLITTAAGGPSEYLGWEYNSQADWQSKGMCKVSNERSGEWFPLKTSARNGNGHRQHRE